MKAKKSYKKGGRMEPIIGMPAKKKLEKLKPIGVKKIDSGESMDKTLKRTVAEVEKPRRKKRRRKFENGGKTKKTSNVNLRGEGKKKSGFRMSEDTYYEGPSGPDYGDYINAEKAAAGRLKKMDKITPKGPDVIGLAKKVKPGTIKKSSAKIPVPAKKRRPRRK